MLLCSCRSVSIQLGLCAGRPHSGTTDQYMAVGRGWTVHLFNNDCLGRCCHGYITVPISCSGKLIASITTHLIGSTHHMIINPLLLLFTLSSLIVKILREELLYNYSKKLYFRNENSLLMHKTTDWLLVRVCECARSCQLSVFRQRRDPQVHGILASSIGNL